MRKRKHQPERSIPRFRFLIELTEGDDMTVASRDVAPLAIHPDFKGIETALLEALLGCTDYGVLISSMTTRQDILCNARFGEIFGLMPDHAIRWTPDLVREEVLPRIRRPQAFLEDLHAVYSNPSLERADELELIHPDQVIRRHTCPLRDEERKILGRVWTFLDITPLKELQREVERYAQGLEALVEERARSLRDAQKRLVESEKLAAVGLLAATTAHDLRNILTPLQIEMSAASGADFERDDALRQSLRRLSALAHRLLSLSQPARLIVSRCDFRAIWKSIENLILAQALPSGCRVEVRMESEPLRVDANPEKIEQIFLNLAMNAIAAMTPSGGVLTVLLDSQGESARARFRDTGPGIAEEIASSLFQPFVTGHPNGTGLGLYSSRRIAREHGGDLLAEDEPGPGAKFVLLLPLASSGEAPE